MNHSPKVKLPPLVTSSPNVGRRKRSGSIVKVEEVGERSVEEVLDRSAFFNINADWVNAKGAWLIHLVLIFFGKIVIDNLPGVTQEISWTAVNLLYLALTYLMFHWVTGIPFGGDLHSGAYDELTLWEQIDDGAQYTPAKKWLFSVPIVLFLASTHYTIYNPWLFAVNITALVIVLIPKLPQLHRKRIHVLTEDVSGSGVSTPVSTGVPPSGAETPSTLPDYSIIGESHLR